MKTKTLLFVVFLGIISTSCGVNYHVRKAIKKGYSCDTVADTITITSIDSIPFVLRDSISWERVLVQKDTIVRYKRSKVPKTRFETRIEYKLKRDTIRLLQKEVVYRDRKEQRDTKKPNLWLFIIGFCAGYLAKFLMKFSKTVI